MKVSVVCILSYVALASAALISRDALMVAVPVMWAAVVVNLNKPVSPDAYTLYNFINMGMSTSVSLMATVGICGRRGDDSGWCRNAKAASLASLGTAGYLFQTTPVPSYTQWVEFIPYRGFWNREFKGVGSDLQVVKQELIQSVNNFVGNVRANVDYVREKIDL